MKEKIEKFIDQNYDGYSNESILWVKFIRENVDLDTNENYYLFMDVYFAFKDKYGEPMFV